MIARYLRTLAGCSVIAGAGLLACVAPEEDTAEDTGALSAACDKAKTGFYDGKKKWSDVRLACDARLDEYRREQEVNFDWFNNSPLGLAGPPVSVLIAMMKDDPENWPSTKDGMNTLGMGDVFPTEEKETQPRMGLPYGLVYAKNPDTKLHHAFFSCGGCHTGRVVGPDGKVKMLVGAPNTEIDAQMFGWRVSRSMLGKYAVAEKDANGKYVYGADGYPKFTLTKAGEALEARAKEEIRAFPGINLVEYGVTGVAWNTIMKKLVAGAVRTATIYGDLQKVSGAYDGKANSPDHIGPRPGMMEAYGFASGLVYTHALRDDFFAKTKARYGNDYKNHPFFKGIAHSSDKELFEKARARIRDNPKEWLAPEPAPVDVKSLYFMDDRPNVGWDGNQAGSARVIASGTSAVGDPWNVNLPIHQGMDKFIQKLPPAPYPFDVDQAKAKAGEALFTQNCAGCHKAGNEQVYRLSAIGTDPNRANIMSPIARAGLVELIHQACDGTGNGADIAKNVSIGGYGGKDYDNSWCTPPGDDINKQDNMLYRTAAVRGNPNVGYKADDLRGIWNQAPFLHNGSVPTLWHLLNPSERPKKFVRGNINYDPTNVGFEWKDAAPKNYKGAHTQEFDTTLRGQSNAGHSFGEKLTPEQKWQLIEYMKTL